MSQDTDFYDGFEEEEEEELQVTPTDRRLLLRLLRYLKPYRARVAAAILLMVVASALGIAGPLLLKMAIDRTLGGDVASLADRHGLLAQIAGLYAAILAVTAFISYFQIMVLQTTGQRVMLDLRRDLFAHLMRQDLALFDRQPVGRLMTRLTSDIEALNELFTSGLVTVIMDVLTLLAIMGVMLWLDWKLALLSFTVIPALFMLAIFFRRRVRDAFRKIRVRVARINSFLQEHMAGAAVVQTFGQGPRRLERFDTFNLRHTQAHLDTVNAFAVFFPAVEVISTAAVVLLLWKGGGWVAAGAVSLGTLVAFVQYAQRFYRPISDLSEKVNILQGAMAASERVFDLLDTQPTLIEPERPQGPTRARGEIRFENVHFGYIAFQNEEQANPALVAEPPAKTPVLHGLSFHVKPGERVAIVGSTGAGKTTVISLLTRFYEVDEGCVEVDGIDVRDWNPSHLRQQMALVLQDPRLFSGSVRDNLTLWEEGFDPERLRDAIDRIGLDRVIARLPQGIDEEMREGGSRLSTGERQLVAFARALAHDPPILILDEATASIDSETEARVQAATEELLKDRTSVVIAHRLSTVRNADRILVMHHGRLVEEGTHDELMAVGKLYRRLVELQMGASTRAATAGDA